METVQLDFSSEEALTGFRLERFELLNWGTFDRHIWRIDPAGRNSLLTGDIGSGKSTLVDALTTLLAPHNRITYNKAAGAEGRERSLYSYVRGEYKSEQDAATQTARAIALRDEKHYTVLLAYFHNAGFDQGATLAQVFWLKEGQRNPERFYLFAEQPLSIAEHFNEFDGSIQVLRKNLRKLKGVALLSSFKEYAGRFRRFFGIQHEKALELFYQTVSMKSVGNLTDFVRNHMLEQSDVSGRIDELRRAFDNLNRAHDAVLKAKAQINRLEPMIADGERYGKVVSESSELTGCRDALVFWFAEREVALIKAQVVRLSEERASVLRTLEKLLQTIDTLRLEENSLKAGIEDSGGSRLRVIDLEIQRLESERQRRQLSRQRYAEHCQAIELPSAEDTEGFSSNRQSAKQLLEALQQQADELDNQRTDMAVTLREHKNQGEELEQELQSLRGRRSNIPRHSLELRSQMAEDLNIDETNLPFAGELLQVDEAEIRWEGALERLLHNFALSMLVPDEHYAAVSRYVDKTRLRGRLVYFRAQEEKGTAIPRSTSPDALYRKLRIKPDSPFYEWLERWLASRFDHICCEDLSQFRRQPKALTLQGQIKSGGKRHEKDDRHALQDRARFVLGWSNEEKILALETSLAALSTEIMELAQQSQEITTHLRQLTSRRDHARDLRNIIKFDDIDWQTPARSIASLEEEKRQIEESSNTLKQLRDQLVGAQERITLSENKKTRFERQDAQLEDRIDQSKQSLEAAIALTKDWNNTQRERLLPRLVSLFEQTHAGAQSTLQNLDKQQRTLREHIQAEIDKLEARRKRLNDKLIAAMLAYKTDYPTETQEVDTSINALAEFGVMLTDLQTEDLPRHEARFREMLREETIQGVAMFRAQLDREQKEISDKIDTINRSLKQIEYNPGTFIRLVQDIAQDVEIREFRQDMKQLLSHSMDEEELYTEEKFLQVKAIIDRLNGREGFSDQDRRWTRKVTDVRNWFLFSASERWLEDDSEREFYSDTAGKSGGQKEKLAYTILASALAYQFGLEWGNARSRSFRFVVIDEAFGRGSDESTRYALELFRKLNLQLLIVTPLQKIHIIEDYINAVHYVHNEGGKNSVLSNLSVEEYQARKKEFQAIPAGTNTPKIK